MPRPDGLVASVLFTSSQEMTQLPPRMRVQGWKLMDARLESTSLSPSALTRLLLGFIWDDPPTAETAIEVVAAEATEMMTTMTVGTVVVVDVITTADPPPPTTVRGGTIAPVPDHTHPVITNSIICGPPTSYNSRASANLLTMGSWSIATLLESLTA
uniref:Uncharacterized protein n=1 Tax=Cacopsylla melanoneura TaxID=428564 RepID=A0A8D8RN46_9HEMI